MPAAGTERIVAEQVVAGFTPKIRLVGMERGAVRIHMFRMFSQRVTDDPAKRTGWHQAVLPLHAWVDVRGDAKGSIDLSRFAATNGTYRGADAYGLLWSGRKFGDPLLADASVTGFDASGLHDGENRIVVRRGGAIVDQAPLRFAMPPGLVATDVANGVLNGAYAASADGKRHPAIILLHGSESGDRRCPRACATLRRTRVCCFRTKLFRLGF